LDKLKGSLSMRTGLVVSDLTLKGFTAGRRAIGGRPRTKSARPSNSAPSDLVGHLNYRNLTELDLAVTNGELPKPRVWSPFLDVLRERGIRHEQRYVEHLRAKGHDIAALEGVGFDAEAITATIDAMRLGRDVIVQGAFLAQ
jgi:hypothetical protein